MLGLFWAVAVDAWVRTDGPPSENMAGVSLLSRLRMFQCLRDIGGVPWRRGKLERRTAELEAGFRRMSDQLGKVTVRARSAERLSTEDAKALELVLIDVNEIRRDLDALREAVER